MMPLLQGIAALALFYLTVELLWYWAPLAAARVRRVSSIVTAPPRTEPLFCILCACRDAAECIEGLVKSFRQQDYPADRIKLFLVADNCRDNSAQVARSLGMEVYERHDLSTSGKGNALNDILTRRLKEEPFDALVVLDVDARVEPYFLRRAARYFPGGPVALACATYAKNPEETLFTHVGTMIQALLRLHQQGRAALGLDAAIYGSHGYALSREAVARLGWHTTTGQIAEDMELRLRCTLHHIPVRYAADLAVYNDVTADVQEAHEQRRRWNSTYLPLIPEYFGALLGQAIGDHDWKALDALFGLLILPAFANLFLYLTFVLFGLGLLCWPYPALRPYAAVAVILWMGDIAYFITAFKTLGLPLERKELSGFAAHLGVRLLALAESIFFVHVKIWPPAPHRGDS